MITESSWGTEGFGVASILGSWSEHYKSWQSLNFAPKIIVKYENLINDTKGTLISILNFLSNLMDIKIEKKKSQNRRKKK